MKSYFKKLGPIVVRRGKVWYREEIGPKVVTRTIKNILSVQNELLSIAILPR